MKLFAPDYYKDFYCIADLCRHNCCIGWEIDIDEKSLETYKQIQGSFGERLDDSISVGSGTAHFTLGQNDRCPFLNSNNLCDIILELGEDKLCNICTDHPRFRNFFSARTEIGLGLCCEAAGRLILSKKEKTLIVEIGYDDEIELICDDEQDFYIFRQHIIDILQNRTKSIKERIQELIEKINIQFPEKSIEEWVNIFLKLEQLDPAWSEKLKELLTFTPTDTIVNNKWDIPFEQLLVYFVIRHLADGLDDGLFRQRIAFAILSYYMIYTLLLLHIHKFEDANIDDLIELSRLYSSEIEYSEENVQKLLEILCDP